MKNRITELFEHKKEGALNIYFTAGYPELNDTMKVLKSLEDAGADLVEIGVPYSDPLADGPTIQASGQRALENGMTLKVLMKQLEGMRETIKVPVMLMGYFNTILQYGVEAFVEKCVEVGVDGIIFPDLPFQLYNERYKKLFEENNLSNIFLVTPQTSDERLIEIDQNSSGFIYVVSTNSTTGNESKGTDDQRAYFERIKNTDLKNPTMIGFNIKDNATFANACNYANGAIIGSAFIKMLSSSKNMGKDIKTFVSSVKG